MLPIFGNSQVIDGKTYSPFNNYYKWRGGAFDTTLLIPTVASPNGKRPGAIRYSLSDSSIYSWTGNQWIRVTGYDTSSLSLRIEQRVRYSDTASMLSGYLLNAYNGLTKTGKDVKLGGSLTENTNINLNTRNLSIITGGDTTRFFPSGVMSVGGSTVNASASYKLNVNGSTWTSDNLVVGSPLGNGFNINTTSTIAYGFTGPGIYRRIGNPYNTYFMESNQSGSKDKWAFISQFGGYDSIPRDWSNQNSSIVNVNMGWGSPNQSGLSASTLLIDPIINVDSVGGGVGNNFDNLKIRGVYYAPKLNKLDGVTHVGYENTTGGNMFNSVSGNTRIGYSTFDTTYKLDVNGNAKVFKTLSVGNFNRDTIQDQWANIFSNKEIMAQDGFMVWGPTSTARNKTGMDGSANLLRFWSGNAPIAYVNYLGGGSNSFNFRVSDSHNTGAGLSGNVNTVEIAGSLINIYGSNTTVHNQIAILPQIIDSFGIGKWRGIYYNPDVQYLGVPLNHIAYENTVGNNLLNTTSGNTLIGTTSDSTFKLHVNGRTRISDTLTLSTTPVTSDTSANDLLVINSTNGQVRRYSGAWPFANDTATVVKAFVRNVEGTTITKGQVVYLFGASGDKASVKLARNTSDTFSSKTLGIVRDDILAGETGWVITQGQVSGINLGAYTEGDVLWLDSLSGGFTKTKPQAPKHTVFVGIVERANAGNGIIYVKPQNGYEFEELHNVKITSVAQNNLVAYDTTQAVWKNVTFNDAGNIKTASLSLDFGSTAAQNSSDLTITVTGASDGDVVSLGVPNGSVNANSCFTAWVSATDTVTIRFNNYSSGAIDPASGTFKIKVFK